MLINYVNQNSNVHLTSINKLYKFCQARVILRSVGEVYIVKHRFYILAKEHARALILGIYLLLGVKHYKYCHA